MERRWRVNWIVVIAVIVHLAWGVVLLFTPAPLMTTPMAEVPWNYHHYIASATYLFAGGLAAVGLLWRRLDEGGLALLCCLPQQALLMTSAFTAIRCVARGAYADGVPRPWEFILCDQLWGIAGMIGHTVSLIDWYWFAPVRKAQ